jgi:hypothetical protein
MRLGSSARTVVLWNLAVVIGLVAAGCSGANPSGPTPLNQIDPQSGIATSAFGTSTRGRTDAAVAASVSWACFTGESFGASRDCPALRVGAQSVGTGEIITTAPTSLDRGVNGTTVTLRWGVPPGNQPTSYVIEAGTGPGLSNITVFDTGNSATGLTVNNVPPGTYYVRVRGRDASGTGPVSNEVIVVVTGPAGQPAACAPRNLTATVIGSDLLLDWNGPPGSGSQCGSDRYLVQVGSTPGANDLAQVSTTGLVSSYGATGLPPGTYYVRVRSQGATLLSEPSNEVAVTVTGVNPPGVTRWAGLVANGEGASFPGDDDCPGGGIMRADVSATIVQSGASLNGFLTLVIRVAPSCPAFVGFTVTESITGTASGSLASGAGNFTLSQGESTTTGTFSNGLMTGSVTGEAGPGGTVTMRRQ